MIIETFLIICCYFQSGDVSKIFSSDCGPGKSVESGQRNKDPEEIDFKATLRDVQSLGAWNSTNYVILHT